MVDPVSRRFGAITATLASVILLASCSGDSPSMLDPRGNEAKHIATAWWIMFSLAIGVYVLVAGFIVVAVLRGRRTEHARAVLGEAVGRQRAQPLA